MSTPATLVADLVATLRLPDVPIGPDGACGLLFDNEVNVTLEPDPRDPSTLHLHTTVGRVPDQNPRAFYERLLRANYLGHGTEGFILALDEAGRSVLLSTSVDSSHWTVEGLSDLLVKLVRVARLWTGRLASHAHRAQASGAPGWDANLAHMLRV